MIWSSRLRRHIDHEQDSSWGTRSRYGPGGALARRLLRRVLRPLLVRARRTDELVGRSLGEIETLAGLEALAADPPLVAGTVACQSDVGALLLHAEDLFITPSLVATGAWEPAEAAWLRSALRPGHTFLDCGANVGYFTLLGAGIVGPGGSVIAVEPEAANLRLLRFNVWRNARDNVSIVPVAAADVRGVLALRRHEANTGDHQVHAEARSGDVWVPSVALDDLLDGTTIDVVKIDTQGADHLVLAGLARALERNPRMQLLVEFWSQGMDTRGIRPLDVLGGYRRLGRPICLLQDDGGIRPATDAEIISATDARPDRWSNLVLGARD